jgi:hypothetical protein
VRTLCAILVALSLSACGASPARTTRASDRPPQSLDEALAARDLERITLASVRSDRSHEIGGEPRLEGRRLVATETAGWNSSPSIFARRRDGAIVLVRPRPRTIVDRHVAGGCLLFAGGRGWFETVEYELPDGAVYAGAVDVDYEHHTEVVDHSDTQPDGSPCPPPARD